MSETYASLDVDQIHFDTDNPRIKMALEKYGDHLNAERIHFALRSAAPDGASASSYASLRDSIRATKGVTVPITVIPGQDGYVCIDGNTRLAIYKRFLTTDAAGNWSTIPAIVRDAPTQVDIERIRVSAHLVGARQWPAYEKARYLHYLRNKQLMEYGEMIQLCGGNRPSIERQIEAYHDMNEYYRDVVDDTAFHIDRYSGFVELQKRGIKEAIYDAGLDLGDFGEWIRDGKIFRLADVRQLPKVLADPEAKAVFLDGGFRSIETAVQRLAERHRRQGKQDADTVMLRSASTYDLAASLADRIEQLPYSELRTLKNREGEAATDAVTILENLYSRLAELLEDVTE